MAKVRILAFAIYYSELQSEQELAPLLSKSTTVIIFEPHDIVFPQITP